MFGLIYDKNSVEPEKQKTLLELPNPERRPSRLANGVWNACQGLILRILINFLVITGVGV